LSRCNVACTACTRRHPPQHARQLDLQAQIRARRLQTLVLLDGTDDRFDLGQGARQARGQRSGNRLKVRWPCGQYQRAIKVPGGERRS
jgi:hypothetical protein